MNDDITRLLVRWAEGESAAGEALLPLVYERLHALARTLARRSDSAVELQPTELVAEAWLKLDHADLEPMHRRHFIALSARIMRQVLVDHARRRQADKRGGGWLHVTLSRLERDRDADVSDLLALDDAMDQLAERHSRAAHVIELHYFGGMTAHESAAYLNVTPRTIERDLRFGRAWLKDHLDA